MDEEKGKLVATICCFVGLVLYHGALSVMESLETDGKVNPPTKKKRKKKTKKISGKQ